MSDLTELDFPAICLSGWYGSIKNSLEDLTTTTEAGLKKGYYKGMIIIDSSGKYLSVLGAVKKEVLAFAGKFNPFGIFLNPTIRIELLISDKPVNIPVEDAKQMILESFDICELWSASDEFEKVKKAIKQANSFKEIFTAVALL